MLVCLQMFTADLGVVLLLRSGVTRSWLLAVILTRLGTTVGVLLLGDLGARQ